MKKLFLLLAVLSACSETKSPEKPQEAKGSDTIKEISHQKQGYYLAPECTNKISIDGEGNEEIWSACEWMKMDQVWLGDPPDSTDYSGQFKACWNKDYIYFLVEIIDDSLVDTHEDPLDHYWDDDCVEIFVDEDNSDGNHQFNYNAFAYHVALDYTVVDIGIDSIPHIYKHVDAKRTKSGDKYYWEIAMQVYTSDYDDSEENSPIELTKGKELGFMIAYCDNDISEKRENFIGTIFVEGEDKDQGWIDAGVFGSLILK